MTTIPQRLREIAVRIDTNDMAAYVQLRAIAAELEAPVADAPKVVMLWRETLPDGRYDPNAKNEPLICQRDHLAAVSALQARIKDLETQLKTRSQKLREAGYTRRPSAKSLPPDE